MAVINLERKIKGESPETIEEYKKERRKLQNRVYKMKARGYSFSSDVIPQIPQYVRQGSIRNLQKRSTEWLYQHSVYVSPEATKIKGYERKEQVKAEGIEKRKEPIRQKHYEKLNAAKNISQVPVNKPVSVQEHTMSTLTALVENLEYRGTGWADELIEYKDRDSKIMELGLKDAIAKSKLETVLKRIADNMTRINEIVSLVIFGSGEKYHLDGRNLEVNRSVQEFLAIITGEPVTAETSKYYTELAEQANAFERIK